METIIKKSVKLELWKERLEDQHSSGLTQKEWCAKNDLSISTLRYWIRRIKNQELNPHEDTIKPTEAPIDFAGIIVAPDSLDEKSDLARQVVAEIIEIKMCDAVLTI